MTVQDLDRIPDGNCHSLGCPIAIVKGDPMKDHPVI
jgi:hypothetical protein